MIPSIPFSLLRLLLDQLLLLLHLYKIFRISSSLEYFYIPQYFYINHLNLVYILIKISDNNRLLINRRIRDYLFDDSFVNHLIFRIFYFLIFLFLYFFAGFLIYFYNDLIHNLNQNLHFLRLLNQ